MDSNEVEEAGIGGSGKGPGCWGTILVTYHFNQMMNTIEGEWRGVEPQIVHLGLFRSLWFCLYLGGWAIWVVWHQSEFLSYWKKFLSSTAGAMFPYWLCSCFTLAGVAIAASFPLWPQFHWKSSPAAVVLSSSSPGLNDARPGAASLPPVSLTLFTASEKNPFGRFCSVYPLDAPSLSFHDFKVSPSMGRSETSGNFWWHMERVWVWIWI